MDRVHIEIDVKLIANGCVGINRFERYVEVDIDLANTRLSSAGKIVLNLAIVATTVSADYISVITGLSTGHQAIPTN
jgi:hypothetical protein